MLSIDGSIFQALKSRELHCSRVHGRPCMMNMTSDKACSGSGVLTVEPNGTSAPPLAISFGKTTCSSHLLAVADEEGFVSIFDTCRRLPSSISSQANTGDVRTELWLAHSNAIFDLCWVRDDAHMLTASGDQTVRLWDVEARAGLGVMKGHLGSVKSLSGHPYQAEIFASGSRDGSVALWDMRSSSTRNSVNEQCFVPVSMIGDAHIAKQSRRLRGSKAITKSVTAVLYLKDDHLLATAGAADGVVKFWDDRNLKLPVAQSSQSLLDVDVKGGRVHGIAGLSQDPTGTYLIASCTDNRVYLYNVLQPERGPIKSFSGHILGSFYIKAKFSPDGTHILSGSSDGNVFIWEMHKPESPSILKGHGGEVTAVDWCSTDFCKMATCSDDFTVRIWSNLEPRFDQSYCFPSVIRRRISAEPCIISTSGSGCPYPATTAQKHDSTFSGSPNYRVTCKTSGQDETESRASMPINMTRQSQIITCPQQVGSLEVLPRSKQGISNLFEMKKLQDNSVEGHKSPEAAMSPSSVLSPPRSSKRRTIIDYYGTL